MNGEKKDIVYEIADLQYHLMVLMVEKGITPDDIYDELRSRR
jgi:phosphoribosyl-ATP pyrophosphohydrolase